MENSPAAKIEPPPVTAESRPQETVGERIVEPENVLPEVTLEELPERPRAGIEGEMASLRNDKTAFYPFYPLTYKSVLIIHPPIGDHSNNSGIKKVGKLERESSGGSERLAVTPPPRLRSANFFNL